MTVTGLPFQQKEPTQSEMVQHPLDQVIWRALTSVQRHLAEGDERARRYQADIAPFAAIVDREAASFRSLLALLGAKDQVALVTTAGLDPPSIFNVVHRASVDQMVLEDAPRFSLPRSASI